MSNHEGQGVEISAYQGPNHNVRPVADVINVRPVADVIYGVDDIMEVKPESASIHADSAPVAAVAINRTRLIVAMIIATISTALILPVKISVVLSRFCLYCGARPAAPEWYLPAMILLYGSGMLLYGYAWLRSRGPSSVRLNVSAAIGFFLDVILLGMCGTY